jgi:tetratricopeptide (TPR) repeat protein
MNSLSIVLIALASSAVGGGVAASLAAQPVTKASGDDGLAAHERLAATVATLASRQDVIDRKLSELGGSTQLAPVGDARVSVGDIDAAVARWMEANSEAGLTSAPMAAEVDTRSHEERVAAAVELLDGELSDMEVQRLWREFAEEGLTDDIVAAFEALAEASPNDPDLQVELGSMYLNKITEVGTSPEAGLWAQKADASFDRALEIDDHHWNARFNKAVSLSFWPPVFGKQGEAIKHFEILVGQQAGVAGGDGHVQTHLLLGNMYQQIGEHEKALGAWRGGLEYFPEHEGLMEQIEVFGGQ